MPEVNVAHNLLRKRSKYVSFSTEVEPDHALGQLSSCQEEGVLLRQFAKKGTRLHDPIKTASKKSIFQEVQICSPLGTVNFSLTKIKGRKEAASRRKKRAPSI